MRSQSIRFGLIVLCAAAVFAACTTAHRATLPATGGDIRVRVQPGAGYLRPEGDSVAVLRLLDCTQPERDQAAHTYALRGRPTVARNEVGDAVEIAADAVRPGTRVGIVRPRGRPYRWVVPSNGGATSEAALTIDLRGCTPDPGTTVVHWTGRRWVDMGGVVRGSAITVRLPHLSIYAVAGGRDPEPEPEPTP